MKMVNNGENLAFTRKEFYRIRYLPLEDEFLTRVGEYCTKHQWALKKDFLACLQVLIQDTKEKTADAAHWLQCTFLYTSFLAGRVELQMFFRNEQGSVLSGEAWRCHWMADLWRTFVQQVTDERFYVRSRLHSTMFVPFYVDTIRQLLVLLGEYLKMWLHPELERLLAGLLRTPEFYVTCGGYEGGQECLMRLRPEVDLFHYIGQENLPEDILTYRCFKRKRYRRQKLGGLNLQNSRFVDCLFEPWQFTETDLCNVVFERCRFHLTDFKKVKLSGGCFVQCTFTDCLFQEVQGNSSILEGKGLFPLFFSECSFLDVVFRNCDLAGVDAAYCKAERTRAVDCKL